MSNDDAAPLPGESPQQTAESTENYLEAYSNIADWIRFADAKAGAVLALHGAVAAVLIPTVRTLEKASAEGAMFWIAVVLIAVWLAMTVASAIFAVSCIAPRGGGQLHPAEQVCHHFHPSGIRARFPDLHGPTIHRFVDECRRGGMAMFEREVIAAILLDSHVSARKYGAVSHSIRFAIVSLVAGFTYLTVVQFL